MSKAVVVGERHLIQGFSGAGFDIVALDEDSRLHQELVRLSKDLRVGLVLLTESAAAENAQAVEEFRRRSRAVLMLIPTHEGSRHTGFHEIRRAVERSLGIDLLGRERP